MPIIHANKKIVIVYMIDFLATREGVTGGTEKQLMETISNLDRSKFRPILICLQEFLTIPAWENLNCEKHILHVYSLLSFNCFRSLFSFTQFLKRNSADIVQTFFFDSTLFGTIAARLARVTCVIASRRDMGFWYNKKILRIFKISNYFIDKFLVNSNAIKSFLSTHENIPTKSIEVIYNGIDLKLIDDSQPTCLNREFADIKSNDLIVGLVANFNRSVKRVDLFIKSASDLLSRMKNKNVKFFILGGGKYEKELKLMASDLNIEKHVIFAGTRNNAIPYIKAFNVGVLTSDSEGFSNVILEYMAAGIPVVATNIGGNTEIVVNGETGILVPTGDYKKIADAINTLLSDKEKRLSMGMNARKIIQTKFDWAIKINEVENYYRSLVKH